MTEQHDIAEWEVRWSKGKIGFDQNIVHPALVSLLAEKGEELGIPTSGRALVPGCGRGYDVQLFAERGLDSIGLDISPTGVKAAQEWLNSQPSTNASKQILCADFFTYDPKGKFDLIFDYTFLCALPPTTRPLWSTTLLRLSTPSSTLITLMFPLNSTHEKGPPWPLSEEVYHQLLDGDWELVYFKEVGEGERRKNGPKADEAVGVWKRRG